jgi:hypothetical protein
VPCITSAWLWWNYSCEHFFFERTNLFLFQEMDTTLYDLHLQHFKPIVHTRRGVTSSLSGSLAATSSSSSFTDHHQDGQVPHPPPPLVAMGSTTSFHLDRLPYFAGDFCQSELEIILNSLESSDLSDMMEQKFRKWWRDLVWGPHAVIELIPADKDDEDDDRIEEDEQAGSSDQRVFTRKGLPKLSVLILIKPSLPSPSRDVLLQSERDNCTYQERDEWIMRKIAQAVRPLKESFLVIKFSSLTDSNNSSDPKRQRVEPSHNLSSAVAPRPMPHGTMPKIPALASSQGKLADPDPTLPRTCFDWRIGLLDLLVSEHLQFDTWRRAKFSTAVVLGYLHKSLTAGPLDPEASHW